MNKNVVKAAVWSFLSFVTVLNGHNLLAQEKEPEMPVTTMRMERDNLKRIFSDNKHTLKTNMTDNMLTDTQCREWIGMRSVVQKMFNEIDDCTGDSLYDILYEKGLFVQQGSGDQLFFVGDFNTPNKLLSRGTTKTEIKELLGKPYKEGDLIMVYKKALHPEIAALEGIEFDESVILFFDNNKLSAIWVTFFMLC